MPRAAPLAAAAGDQEEDGEDGEEEGQGAGRGSEGAWGRGPRRPPPAAAVPTPALLRGRHPPGVQISLGDQGTAPPGGAGGEEEEGKEEGAECACVLLFNRDRLHPPPRLRATLGTC